jgi:hypothetical protein
MLSVVTFKYYALFARCRVVSSFICFILEITEWISVKYAIEILHQNLSEQFNYGPKPSDIKYTVIYIEVKSNFFLLFSKMGHRTNKLLPNMEYKYNCGYDLLVVSVFYHSWKQSVVVIENRCYIQPVFSLTLPTHSSWKLPSSSQSWVILISFWVYGLPVLRGTWF